jgi:hypothetical protein
MNAPLPPTPTTEPVPPLPAPAVEHIRHAQFAQSRPLADAFGIPREMLAGHLHHLDPLRHFKVLVDLPSVPLPQLTVDRMGALAYKLLELLPHQFDYHTFVSQDDGACGTTCCAAGWLPAVDPARWSWRWIADDSVMVPKLRAPTTPSTAASNAADARIQSDLTEYFEGLRTDAIVRIFYGHELLHAAVTLLTMSRHLAAMKAVEAFHVAGALALAAQRRPVTIRNHTVESATQLVHEVWPTRPVLN